MRVKEDAWTRLSISIMLPVLLILVLAFDARGVAVGFALGVNMCIWLNILVLWLVHRLKK